MSKTRRYAGCADPDNHAATRGGRDGGIGLVCAAWVPRPGLVLPYNCFPLSLQSLRSNELLHFEKDLAIAGGLFVLTATGAGALSLDRFSKHRRFGWAM